MTDAEKLLVLNDFFDWSGGELPASEGQILVYMDSSYPFEEFDEDARRLAAKFGAMQHELSRILKRMEKRRFPANDELQALTREAFDKLQHLKMKAHYWGCTGVAPSAV